MSRFSPEIRSNTQVSNWVQAYKNPVAGIRSDIPWIRPKDWVTLPTLSPGDQKIVGIVPIYEGDTNYVAFTMSGNYTVDWGDGTTDNWNAGTTASKTLLWASYDASTLTSEGYRQAIVTITPQSGQNLTSVNFDVVGSQTNGKYTARWIEINVAGANITSMTVSQDTSNLSWYTLKRFAFIGTCALTGMNYMFKNCYGLREVDMRTTSSVTSWFNTFYYNTSATNIMINTTAATSFNNTFNGCALIQSIVIPYLPALTSLGSSFQNCSNLQYVNLPYTPLLNNMANTFTSCYLLQYVNIPGTQLVTTFASAFEACQNLRNITLNADAATNMSYMFNGCINLESASIKNMNGTNINATNMFISCQRMIKLPDIDFTKIQNATNMFYGCQDLTSATINSGATFTTCNQMFRNCTNLQKVTFPSNFVNTTMANMFYGCSSLQEVIGLVGTNTTASSGYSNMFANCFSVQRITATNMKYTHSIESLQLNGTQLDAYYTALPTIVSQTLTVTGNWGTATDTPSIATAKGWTVTG